MIVVAIVGLLATVALPQMVNFQARARQSEVKVNLRAWYEVETLYFHEKNGYVESIIETGFSPTVGNRYAYLMSSSCTYQVRNTAAITTPEGANCITVDQNRFPTSALAYAPAAISATFTGAGGDPALPGVAGTCPSCNALAIGTANLDNELAGIDTWLISTKAGTVASCGTSNETRLVPGVVFHVKNDVNCD